MKRLILFLFLFSNPALQGDERILDFHSDITVHPDTSLSVVETIKVRAERNQIKRGIFRDFPQLYKSRWGLVRKRGFEVLEVLRNGKKENYAIEDISGGTRVRIGRGNVFLDPGIHTYTIRYKTTRQLGYFDHHDELYWNVTGNGWAFPIDRASAVVHAPVTSPELTMDGWTGEAGSQEQAIRTEIREGDLSIETTRPLGMREGLTLVATWPKGHLDYEADPQGLAVALIDNPAVALGFFGILGLLAYYYTVWSKFGKDPGAGTIIPLYEPPEGFSPAAVRHLSRMGFDDKSFSAAVIGLAAKGVIQIKEADKVYCLTKTGEPADLTADEQALYNKFFSSSKKLWLKKENHRTIGGGKTALKKSLVRKLEKTHFVKNLKYWVWGLLIAIVPVVIAVAIQNPEALFMLLWLAGWSAGTMLVVSGAITSKSIGNYLFALPFVAGWIFGIGMFVAMASAAIAILFALSAITVAVFYHLLKAPTRMGRQVLDQIEGFKQYLSVAEADRLNLVNPPERTPELFERFLPYALALDVDQEWSEQFSDVLAAAGQGPGEGHAGSYRPSFYTGSRGLDQMTAGALTSAIAGSLTTALASSAVSPSSSSGSGGGGSSGGGGGGGGGGGW